MRSEVRAKHPSELANELSALLADGETIAFEYCTMTGVVSTGWFFNTLCVPYFKNWLYVQMALLLFLFRHATLEHETKLFGSRASARPPFSACRGGDAEMMVEL